MSIAFSVMNAAQGRRLCGYLVLFVGGLGLLKAELFPEVLAGTKIPMQEDPPSPQSDSCVKMGNGVSLAARPNWLTPCVFVEQTLNTQI